MSLILEALKKSERQRQQGNGLPPELRKRTIAPQNHRPQRRPYCCWCGSCRWPCLPVGSCMPRRGQRASQSSPCIHRLRQNQRSLPGNR
jgi:hypothetical protein